jgi:hypothetical protein
MRKFLLKELYYYKALPIGEALYFMIRYKN